MYQPTWASHPSVLRKAIHSISVVDVNNATLQLYEAREKSELLGPLDRTLDAQSVHRVLKLIVAITEGKEEIETESTAVTFTGRKLDLLIKSHIPAEGDEYPYVLVSIIDISARKSLERILTEERALLQAVIDNIPDQVFLKDRESKYMLANRTLAEWAGAADPRQLVGKSDLDMFPRDAAQKYRRDDKTVLRSGRARANIEEQIISASGSQGWALTTKVPVRDQAGRVTGLVGIVRDITERKILERRIEDERALLRAVIDAVPDAIFLKDKENRFILANQATADTIGASSPVELIGRTDREFYPENVAGEFLSDEKDVIEKGRPMIDKEEPKRIAGVLKWIAVTKLPVHDSAGKIIGLLGIGHDFTERKRFEGMLRESEESYRAIFMDAPVGIFHSTPGGKLLSVNPAFAQMMGYDSPAQIMEAVNRKNVAEVLYENPERRSVLIDELKLDPGWHRVETRYSHRGGGVVVAQLMVRAYIPPGASDPELEGFVEDITERRRAEQGLSRERTFLTALMDNIPDSIYFKDRQSRFLLNNRAHAQALGAGSPSEMLGKTDFDYFGPEHAQKAFDDEQRIVRTGQPLIDDLEEETWPDRPQTYVSSTKMPLRDEKGEIIGTFGVSRDMTERRQIEQKNLRLAAMIESSNDAIIGVGLDDTVMSWNKGAEKIFGYTAEEMIGRPITTLLSPDIQDEEPGEKLAREGHVQQFESTATRKDGKVVFVSTSFSPFRDSNGSIIGITSICRDVTAQRALQVQVIRSQRLESLGTLAAGVAHQFNNINAAIKGYLDILAQNTTLPAPAPSYVKEALKGVQRAVEITERLQGLTSAAATAPESLRLEEVVPTLVSLFDEKFHEGGISIQIEFQETLPVRVGRAMVSFVVTSLVTNSIHALIDCSSRLITIRTRRAPGFSSLEVRDTGCGILPENLPRIFTPFFTTKGEWAEPKSPQSRVKGVGLSLAVCQSSVAESGGWIEVESGLGQGSTFRVFLPAAAPANSG